jgi:hypothetical protein
MKKGGIKKCDGFLVHGITQKFHLKFVRFFVVCLLLTKETGILT